jgi:hypothetical protein
MRIRSNTVQFSGGITNSVSSLHLLLWFSGVQLNIDDACGISNSLYFFHSLILSLIYSVFRTYFLDFFLGDFRESSKGFLEGTVSAKAYLELFQTLVPDPSKGETLLLQLIKLLPFERKRIELHQAYAADKVLARLSRLHKPGLMAGNHSKVSEPNSGLITPVNAALQRRQGGSPRVTGRSAPFSSMPQVSLASTPQLSSHDSVMLPASTDSSAQEKRFTERPAASDVQKQDGASVIGPGKFPSEPVSGQGRGRGRGHAEISDDTWLPVPSGRGAALPVAAQGSGLAESGAFGLLEDCEGVEAALSASLVPTKQPAQRDTQRSRVQNRPPERNFETMPMAHLLDHYIMAIKDLELPGSLRQDINFLSLLLLEVTVSLTTRFARVDSPAANKYQVSATKRKALWQVAERVRFEELLDFGSEKLGLLGNSKRLLTHLVSLHRAHGTDVVQV